MMKSMVAMERLVYNATPIPGVIHVLGAELLVADIMIPPVKAEAKAKARPLRGALALVAPGSAAAGAATEVVETQTRRRRSKGVGMLLAISDVPQTSTEIDSDSWWLQGVTTQHTIRAPDSRVAIVDGEVADGHPDSDAEAQQWLDANCGD